MDSARAPVRRNGDFPFGRSASRSSGENGNGHRGLHGAQKIAAGVGLGAIALAILSGAGRPARTDPLAAACPPRPSPEVIFVPGSGAPLDPAPIPVGQPTLQMLYTVRSGDTLWSIARYNGLTVQDLLRANPNITDRDFIQIGQVIIIPNR